MTPAEPLQHEPPHPRRRRAHARYQALKARGDALQERAQVERTKHASVDAIFEMVDRDAQVGGGIIAGAIAYRFFIWLVPLGFVLVGGLGIAADAADEPPKQAAGTLGLGGLVAKSIASAASSPGRWYALLIGIPVLFWATRSVLRVMIGAHRLVWIDARGRAHKPTFPATARFLGLMLGYWALAALALYVRSESHSWGLVVSLLVGLAYAGVWLLISDGLPHAGAKWLALIPGALIVGLGIETLNILSVYVLAPWAENREGTYGTLGLAAALLFGLFLIARLMVGAAIVNATLWERRVRAGRAPAPPPPSAA